MIQYDKSLRKAINKAVRLIMEGRIIEINPNLYYIVGKDRKHIVHVKGNKFECSCKGFEVMGRCSHILAVSAILSSKRGKDFITSNVEKRILRELRKLYYRR